jgi:hypothetical protein
LNHAKSAYILPRTCRMLGTWPSLPSSSGAYSLTCIAVSVFSINAAVTLYGSISPPPSSLQQQVPSSHVMQLSLKNVHTLTFPRHKFLLRLVKQSSWPAFFEQNSQNFSEIFPSSGIPKNTTFRKLDLFPSSGVGGEKTPTQWLSLARTMGPNWEGVFSPPSPEDGNRSSFRNVFFGIPDNGKTPEKFCEFCSTYTIVRILSSLSAFFVLRREIGLSRQICVSVPSSHINSRRNWHWGPLKLCTTTS